MGRKCCVPGCQSNYNNTSGYIPCFQFSSSSDLKSVWIRAINRADFTPSSTAVVCLNHFEERFVIREDRVTRDDGTVLVVVRKKLMLTKDAVPSIFPNQPKYLSKKLPVPRKSPNKRQREIEARDEANFAQWCSDDSIASYQQFITSYRSKLNDDWQAMEFKDFILFYKVTIIDYPRIPISFKVFTDLSVEIFQGETLVKNSFKWLLGNDLKCCKWTQFENMLHMLRLETIQISAEDKIAAIIQLVKLLNHEMEESGEKLKLSFLEQQLELLDMKRLRYSPKLLLWSAKFFFTYPAAYNCIRNTEVLTLPHPCYLRKLTKVLQSGSSHCTYLKKKVSLLKEEEKLVNLLLDEIYVDPSVDYKGGHLYGLSENSDKEATTIQSFMITSIFSHNKDVVALFPVSNMNATHLYTFSLKVLEMLHECGFTVLSLISDNNKVNNRAFALLCGGTLKSCITNPHSPGKKLFFLFDSVHLIKSVRNNWMNQVATQQVLYFPHPDTSKICKAKLSLLKLIHKEEKLNVVKVAPKLSLKVLYPTSVERQNVNHALNLFHETNCSALDVYKSLFSEEEVEDTKCFIQKMINWWNIMNVKHPSKGQHLRQSMCDPIFDMKSNSIAFLHQFSDWIGECINLRLLKAPEKKVLGVPTKGGLLSNETASALKFSTDTLLQIVDYLFTTVGPSYVLLGKFQTDHLEARFGQYRQMSGANYKVSCMQVMESETKLKILSLISLYSQQEGEFKIKNLVFNCDSSEECEIPEKFFDLFNTHDDIDISAQTMAVLIYISGYVSHKICEKVLCIECMKYVKDEEKLSLECDIEENFFCYLKMCDRGGLKWPQQVVINSAVVTYQLFTKILLNYESDFLKCKEPKQLLVQLAMEKLNLLNEFSNDICDCGNSRTDLMKHCLSTFCNIFLNNYTKMRNDKKSSSSDQRKLAKFIP